MEEWYNKPGHKLGCEIHTNDQSVVMYVLGHKCRVTVDVDYDEYCNMPTNAKVSLELTDEDLTVSESRKQYYKFGGYPVFVQSPICPVSAEGIPYTYICTINNNWGDMGNGNVFALIKYRRSILVVDDVFVEASCS